MLNKNNTGWLYWFFLSDFGYVTLLELLCWLNNNNIIIIVNPVLKENDYLKTKFILYIIWKDLYANKSPYGIDSKWNEIAEKALC